LYRNEGWRGECRGPLSPPLDPRETGGGKSPDSDEPSLAPAYAMDRVAEPPPSLALTGLPLYSREGGKETPMVWVRIDPPK